MQIVLALRPPRRLARSLYRGQQQSNESPDDGHHDKKFDESECLTNRMHNPLGRIKSRMSPSNKPHPGWRVS
jgi:hypothetical protein